MSNNMTQEEIEIINVDDQLHKTIIKKYMQIISFDVIGSLLVSLFFGFFAFKSGFKPVPFIICVIFLAVIFYQLSSLLKIMLKKYQCCRVKVDKVWSDNGVYMCRITPDAFAGNKLTSELTLKNYTKNCKDVKMGDKVIAVVGKFSRYLYIFDYEGDVLVSERRKLNVNDNSPVTAQTDKYHDYDDIREVEVDGVGTVYFDIVVNTEGVIEYQHQKGLDNTLFGPHTIICVSGCNIPEDKFDDTLASIENTFKNSESILEPFYDKILQKLGDGLIMPTDEIDKEYLKEALIFDEMCVLVYDKYIDGYDAVVIDFFGFIQDADGDNLIPGKIFMMRINCNTGKTEFDLMNC